MPRIQVVTDSGCDLAPETMAEHSVAVVPLTVRFGDEELASVTSQEFWARCRQTSRMPQTSAPSPGAFGAAFRKAAQDGAEGVLCINLSSRMSATIQAAQAAAKDVADTIPVRVVDSLNISFGQGLQVLAGVRLADDGQSLDDVADAVEAMVPRTRLFGVLDTLDNLRKGGRIGSAKALVGSILSVKPVVQVIDGEVKEESTPRTRGRALRYLADKIAQAAKNGEFEQLAVMNGDASDFDEFLGMLDPVVRRDNMLVGWVGPVIGTHAGLGVIGCAWVARP